MNNITLLYKLQTKASTLHLDIIICATSNYLFRLNLVMTLILVIVQAIAPIIYLLTNQLFDLGIMMRK